MTEFSQWEREKHSPWIAEMDKQHQALLSLMTSLIRRDAERAPRAELSSLLSMLCDCTVQHFKEEEAYMAATGYQKLDVHQIIHRDLLLELDEQVSRFEAGNGRLGAPLLSFLKFWLSPHITGVDRQYARRALLRPAQWSEVPEERPTPRSAGTGERR